MKPAAYALAAALGVGPAEQPPTPSQQPESDVIAITVPASEVEKCNSEGGCALVTRAFIEQLIEQTKHQAEVSCYRSRKEI
jgi:hypothetical protein